MSKFGDKLTRLHASRVRAMETDEVDEKRVFIADPQDTPQPAPEPTPVARPETVDTPARRAVRQQLEIGERMSAKSSRRSPRLTMRRTEDEPARPAAAPPRRESSNAIGERVADLRTQAEALVAVGGLQAALPLLHEMAALSPTHPYPLKHLAAYWRGLGEERIATYYAERLAAVAPY